jgi:inhibitor of cysteine peptidase
MKTWVLLMAAVIGSLAAVGCTARAEPTKSIDVSMDDVLSQKVITRDITLAVGDILQVSLGANHTTPYRWTGDAQIGDPGIVQQTAHEFVPPNPPSGMVGTPGAELWTFKALKAGATTIATDYTMPANPTQACTFTANVTVQ